MKKILVYILLFSFVSSALTACAGREAVPDDHSVREGMDRAEEKIEEGTDELMTAMPDLNDGFVNDDDGIITEDDNGPMENRGSALPGNGAADRYTAGNGVKDAERGERTDAASGKAPSRSGGEAAVPPATAAPEN